MVVLDPELQVDLQGWVMPPGRAGVPHGPDRAALPTLTGRPVEALAALDVAKRQAARAGRVDLESLCLNYRGLSRAHLGDDGAPDLRDAIAVATAHGCHEPAARAYVNLCDLLHATGRWRELAECVDLGEAFTREHGLWQHAHGIEMHRHALSVFHGDWDTAEEALRNVVEQSAGSMFDVHRLPGYGRLLARRGREQAGAVLERAWRRALRQRAPVGLARAGVGLVEWAWLTGRPDRADEVANELQPRLPVGGVYLRGELLRYLARAGRPAEPFPECPEVWAAGLRGDWQAAAAAWEQLGNPYERALELAFSGYAEPAIEGLRVLDELGAAAAPLARRWLREQGVRPPPPRRTSRGRSHPFGLTDREIEVLDLVTQGATNAEIAARLVLSVRTIDHHVSSILGKLGARTRREAIAAMRTLKPDRA